MTQYNLYISLLLCPLLFSPLSYSDDNVFASAKGLLSIHKPAIEVEYNNSNLISTCPLGAIGCISSAEGFKIILWVDIPA